MSDMEETTMQTTAELRWFKRGTLPAEIFDWFKANELGELAAPEEREDLYLYAEGCDYLGIKLRQGRLEIKWRQAELGCKCFTEPVEGKLEKWGKWLCVDPTSGSFQPATVVGEKLWVGVKEGGGTRGPLWGLGGEGESGRGGEIAGQKLWVGVKKKRFHRLYQVLPNGAIVAVPATEAIAAGCSFELTQLSVAGDAWWSLAFEAFGGDDSSLLETVANWVFKTNCSLVLLAKDSYAYPQWLTVVLT